MTARYLISGSLQTVTGLANNLMVNNFIRKCLAFLHAPAQKSKNDMQLMLKIIFKRRSRNCFYMPETSTDKNCGFAHFPSLCAQHSPSAAFPKVI